MNENEHDPLLISHWDERLKVLDRDELYMSLHGILDEHILWRETQCINLLASEAPMSQSARALLSSAFCSRTAAGHIGPGRRFFAGTHHIDDIEALTHALCKRLFDCQFVEHRVLGGTQACQIVQSGVLKPGDKVIAVSPTQGGDSSNHRDSLLSLLQIDVIDMPFKGINLDIDIQALKQLIKKHPIKMISIGFSLTVSPPAYEEIIALCKNNGIFCHVDCAHELGLIAGKQYPNPLSMGADVMTASTGKTLSGPQGGLILWNDPSLSESLIKLTFPHSVGGYQNNRILALCLTLMELVEFGEPYMQQVVLNSQLFAKQLASQGVELLGDKPHYSLTHQVGVTVLNARHAMRNLERCNIITSTGQLPTTDVLRFGLMECTRLGMTADSFKELAFIISRALKNEDNKTLRAKIKQLRLPYQTYYYCHQHPTPPWTAN